MEAEMEESSSAQTQNRASNQNTESQPQSNEECGNREDGENGGRGEDENVEQNEEEKSKKEEEEEEEEDVIEKAQKLIEKISSSPDNPKPAVLHALSTLLETQESLYFKENGDSSINGRSSHNIGRLCDLVRENDEFFDLISLKFLSETRYSISIKSAAARLLLSCSQTWICPHVFEECVLENLKSWVLAEDTTFAGEDCKLKNDSERKIASDPELLKTYSTGLLAVCLTSGGQILEDVLTSGLSGKLMRYLRIRALGETSTSHRDGNNATEMKSPSCLAVRGRDEGRAKVRQLVETAVDESSTAAEAIERDHDCKVVRKVFEDCRIDVGGLPDGLPEDADGYNVDADSEDRSYGRNISDGGSKHGDFDLSVRDDSARRRVNRPRSRGKGKISEGCMDNEHALISPGSGNRTGQVRSARERGSSKNLDLKNVPDWRKCSGKLSSDGMTMEREDSDDCFQDCRIGSKDISDLVKKAVKAAEAEARAANAPAEAVKAAGDAAAEVVKSAALDEFKASNNEDAAVLAASVAAATVIDAGNTIEVLRKSNFDSGDSVELSTKEPEIIEDVEDFFIPDTESLAQLREKYCIQCLEILGEYVEVLGPALHEKGVDVCLALLQKNSKQEETSKVSNLLPDVMKLICALAAHRKFAALFVDRGGMQKLLAVPRVAQTYFGLSSCLFTIGSLQGIMERVCALPSDVVDQMVELAIQLLECPQDQGRKNAALFFAAAFVFTAVLEAFDARDCLQKLLGLLNDAAIVRSGVNSGAVGLSNPASLRNDRTTAEVLTSSEKQIAYHTSVALRQYFRAHFILIVDAIRPNKSSRSGSRNIPSKRAGNKPLDISNEAMEAVFLQLQRDRKLGSAFVRARWPAVEKFLGFNGHIIMLELCQAPPIERYLHDLLQYALGILHIVTLVPISRKMIVNATLSNSRAGIAVILDAASSSTNVVDPEIIQAALNVLINLVCPPPSISNKPLSNAPCTETRDADRSNTDTAAGAQSTGIASQTPISSSASRLVGDRRISLGVGAGSAGLAAQLEQGYRQARDAVRTNNGIKTLLHLLQQRIYASPHSLDCLRALACRVLLGLARDDSIAQILTRLQVGKKLSELIRDSGGQTSGSEQGRWQAELAQVAIELIAIVTNSGRASTLAATDAATPTLKRIERAAIAAATPITYHSRELLLLVHEHLQASGLADSAEALLKEANLTPLPSLAAPSSLAHHANTEETHCIQLQWPSGRIPGGLLLDKAKVMAHDDDFSLKFGSAMSTKKKALVFSPNLASQSRNPPLSNDIQPSSLRKVHSNLKPSATLASTSEAPSESELETNIDSDSQCKTPILPLKRKLCELKDTGLFSSGKRLNTGDHLLRTPACSTPVTVRKSFLLRDGSGFSTPSSTLRSQRGLSTPCSNLADYFDDNQCSNTHLSQATPSTHLGFLNDPHPSNSERLTLDSVVVQYLKHQHRQCSAPITTLPPLSLLHPHVCPEPRRSIESMNITGRLGKREVKSIYGGVQGNRRNRQFVYNRFRPWRSYRDDVGSLLTCITFVGDSFHIAAGSHSGEIKIFDSNNSTMLDSCMSHQSPVSTVQSYCSGGTQSLLSSSSQDVRLWDASSVSGGPMHSFEGCKAARFSNSGDVFAALSIETAREVLLYDLQTCQLESKLSDASTSSTGRGLVYSHIHFSPSDSMLLWNGVLWDRRGPNPVHRFDQFTDYGGGGFHPTGNEVIINSEVWDLRKLRLMRSVPSLDQTTITFNSGGDVIYATLRRNVEDVMSAFQPRRFKHPLFASFRTLDGINYTDIANIPLERCVLDFATEPTDSFVGLVTMDDQDEMYSSGRVYEIGRRKPTDDDSDPDDAEDEDDEDEEDDDDDDEGDDDDDLDSLFGPVTDEDVDINNDNDSDDDDDVMNDFDEDEEGDFLMGGMEFDGRGGMFDIGTEGDDDEDDDDDSELLESLSSGEEEDFAGSDFF